MTVIDEQVDVARGKPVRIDGKVRTIPAERVARFEAVEAHLAQQYPHESIDRHASERAAALRAAALYLIGELDADGAGDQLHEARAAAEEAVAAAKMVATLASEDGASELGLHKALGVDRLTVRKWLGKQDRR